MMRTIQCIKDGAFWSRTERCLLPRQFVIADRDEIFLGRVALSAKSDPMRDCAMVQNGSDLVAPVQTTEED